MTATLRRVPPPATNPPPAAAPPGEIRLRRIAAAVAIGAAIWVIPTPAGLESHAWHLFALFVATIVAIILNAAPMGTVAIIAMALCAATGVLAPGDPSESISAALSGFSNSTIWLIVSAFFIARAVISSGLGTRLGYLFVRTFGSSTLGLAYGLGLADLSTSPAIPSNTARAGGIVYPIMQSILRTDSSATGTTATTATTAAPRRGSTAGFLALSTYNLDLAASVIFFTGAAPNALGAKLAEQMGVTAPSWGGWFLAACVPGILGFIAVPLVIYALWRPTTTRTPDAPVHARHQLSELGPMTRKEKVTLAVFVTIIALWVGGSSVLNATTVAFIGLGLLLLTGVLTWTDIKKEQSAWDTLTWFAALVMMGAYLNKTGFISWLGELVQQHLGGLSAGVAFVILGVVYALSHYLFASGTAHTATMFSVFLGTGIALGIPATPLIVLLAALPTLMGCLTHYGNGPAPLYFGTGSVSVGTWWKIGLALGAVHLIIWLAIGPLWWQIIGVM